MDLMTSTDWAIMIFCIVVIVFFVMGVCIMPLRKLYKNTNRKKSVVDIKAYSKNAEKPTLNLVVNNK